MNLPVYASPALEVQMLAVVPGFYVGAGVQNLGPCVCAAGA